MNQLGGFPLLTLIVFLPILGALTTLFVPSERRETLRWLTFLIAVTTLFISLFLTMGWVQDDAGVAQFVDGPLTWIAPLGIHYYLGVDGVSLPLVLLTSLLLPVAFLATWPHQALSGDKSSGFWMLLFEGGTLGALTALNMVLFALFWLLALVSTFFLIGSGLRSSHAALRSRVLGSLIVALAIAAVLVLGATVGLSTGGDGLNLPDLRDLSLSPAAQAWLFWTMVLAFGITGAVFPLHLPMTWASVQHVDADRKTAGLTQMLTATLLQNLSGYGWIAFCLSLSPLAAVRFAPVMVILGTVGLTYGALAALGQETLPKTLAHWNVAQMGLTMIGVFSLQHMGIEGAVVHLFARGLSVAALLLLGGARGRETDRSATAGDRVALALSTLSAVGVPGLVGFVGQSTLAIGIIRRNWMPDDGTVPSSLVNWILYAAIALGILAAAWALLRAWQRTAPPPARGAPSRQTVIAIPILVLIVALGLRPIVFSDTIGPAVNRLLYEIRQSLEDGLQQTIPTEPGKKDEVAFGDTSQPIVLAPLSGALPVQRGDASGGTRTPFRDEGAGRRAWVYKPAHPRARAT